MVPDAGEIEFPAADARVIRKPGTAPPAESLRLNVSVVEAPKARELLPLMVIAVPVTSTPVLAVAPWVEAETEIKRFDLLDPSLSVAVTPPFESDTPPAGLMSVMAAEGSLFVENTTEAPETACPLASTTIAVRLMFVAPDEGICWLLASSLTRVPVGPATGTGPVPGPVVVELPNTFPEPAVPVSLLQPVSASAPAKMRLPISDAPSLFMTSPANKRPLREAIRDTDMEPAMLTEIGGRVSEFWNRPQDFEHWPPNYFLVSNVIHHNINFVI